jgi:hypothetical protein
MKCVINTEGSNEILGPFYGTGESVVLYYAGGENEIEIRSAPEDCVRVVEISREEIVAEVERLKRQIDDATGWIGGDSLTAMNSLVGVAAELTAYARVMGAALTPDTAAKQVQTKVESGGYYIASRAHSARFDMESEAVAK